MATLHLPHYFRAWLEDRVRAGYPRETCGLLLGRQNGAGVEVCDVIAARNLNEERAEDRFELNPEDFLQADRAARAAGLELVGIWHSHPDHPAQPSVTDREFAWEGWSYLILSVGRGGVQDVRSWRLADEEFVEEEVRP